MALTYDMLLGSLALETGGQMHISTFLGARLKYDKCRNRRISPLRPADYSRQQGQAADPPASAVQSAPHLTDSNPEDDFFHTRSQGCNLGCKIIPRATHARRFPNISVSGEMRRGEFG